MNNIKLIALFACIFGQGAIYAALPPQYQNQADLQVMVDYVNQNEMVAVGLQYIDFNNKTVTYKQYIRAAKQHDKNVWVTCIAKFDRREPEFKGPGPAGVLYFSSASCEKID